MKLPDNFVKDMNRHFFGDEETGEYPIRFQGEDYLLIGSKTSGAIATREQYENFQEGFAHLMKNGDVMRYGAKIGTRDDIEFS